MTAQKDSTETLRKTTVRALIGLYGDIISDGESPNYSEKDGKKFLFATGNMDLETAQDSLDTEFGIGKYNLSRVVETVELVELARPITIYEAA